MRRIDLREAAQYLRENDFFLILMHGSPDGDTLGCGYALCGALQQIGKKAKAVCPDPIPKKFNYMFREIEEQEFEPQTIITVDVADAKLLYGMKELGEKAGLCIDHHVSNTEYAERLLLAPEYAAACELLFELLSSMQDVKITPCIADCLYTGIATDSGCFKYSNTSPQTHVYAAELMKLGADIVPINYAMFDMKSQGRLKLEQLALSNIRYYDAGRIAVIDVTQEVIDSIEGIDSEDIGALAAMPRQIEGVDIGICIKEKKPGLFKASLRSSENADVAAIAQNFGGGGHARAAGCAFECSLEEAEKQLVWACAKALGRS
ncbi:MAG: bifunctional oligoribonuclease/PAP phosphatase NrnA [Oscillospiraceae bacterium]|nr:bifunctional oligoribonuclease/PAP phosphatase NrnA [Oscillospiraceae bacterium]